MNQKSDYSKFVRAIIRRDEKILLLNEPQKGRPPWNFPGGKVEDGETPEEAVYREVFEEIGVRCFDAGLLYFDEFVFDKKKWHGWYFLCHISDFNFTFEKATKEAGFFSLPEIENLSHGIPERVMEILSNVSLSQSSSRCT